MAASICSVSLTVHITISNLAQYLSIPSTHYSLFLILLHLISFQIHANVGIIHVTYW